MYNMLQGYLQWLFAFICNSVQDIGNNMIIMIILDLEITGK